MSHSLPPEGFKSFPHAGQIIDLIDSWIIPDNEKGILLEFMDRLSEADPGDCPGCLQESAYSEGYGAGNDEGYVVGYREGFRDGGRAIVAMQFRDDYLDEDETE